VALIEVEPGENLERAHHQEGSAHLACDLERLLDLAPRLLGAALLVARHGQDPEEVRDEPWIPDRAADRESFRGERPRACEVVAPNGRERKTEESHARPLL